VSHAILVVCEAPDDFEMGARFIDRSIEATDRQWVRECGLESAREYFGIHTELDDPPERFVRWQHIGKLAVHYSKDKPQRRQLFDTSQFGSSLPDHPDAFEFLRFLRVIQTDDRIPQPDAIVLIRDADSNRERRNALLKLNGPVNRSGSVVVVGIPDPEQECWRLAGFEHEMADHEEAEIDKIHREITVHPIRESHRLQSSNEGEPRHPKNVFKRLTQHNTTRESKCLEAPFEMLRRHGNQNGLTAFLDLLRDRLVPGLFGGAPQGGS